MVPELRWYYVHVDFGPNVQPWLTAIEGSSPDEVRLHLEQDFAAKGVTATIGEIGLLADLPDPGPEALDEADKSP